jgi:hypothetical protein
VSQKPLADVNYQHLGKVSMSRFYHLFGVREDDFHNSHRFVTSWLLPPTLLAALRGLISLYAFITIFIIYGWQGVHGQSTANDRSFSYFTNLTFWGIAMYMLFAAYHTLLYARRGHAPLDRWPRPLQALHTLLYTTVVTFPFLVTIVFWVLLYSGPWPPVTFDAWVNVRLILIPTLRPILHLLTTRSFLVTHLILSSPSSNSSFRPLTLHLGYTFPASF